MNLLEGRDSSTAEVMFNSIDSQQSKHEISWNNCVALGVDNTNANIGAPNSLVAPKRKLIALLSSDALAIFCIMHPKKPVENSLTL